MTGLAMRSRILGVICLSFVAWTPAACQLVTEIDAHGKQGAVSLADGSWLQDSDARQPTALEIVFKPQDLNNMRFGGSFEYELVVTNTGKFPFAFPQSLDWSEDRPGFAPMKYLKAIVVVEVAVNNNAGGGSLSLIPDAEIILYGSPEDPSTQLNLRPGESVRILGSAVLPDGTFCANKRWDIYLNAELTLIQSTRSQKSSQSGDLFRRESKTLARVFGQSKNLLMHCSDQ